MRAGHTLVICLALVMALATSDTSVADDGEKAESVKTHELGGMTGHVFDPVVVALSETGETRWGHRCYHSYPGLSDADGGQSPHVAHGSGVCPVQDGRTPALPR